MKKPIPNLASDADAEHFLETSDLTKYDLSGFKPAKFEFQAKAAQLNMRLPQTLLDAVKAAAKARGVPYTRLVREALEHVVARSQENHGPLLHVHRVGNIELMENNRLILIEGQSILLPPKQQGMLELLIQRQGMVITKEVFLLHLFTDDDPPEIRVIDVLMARLRKALAEAGASPAIRTVWGRGYTLQEVASAQIEPDTITRPSNEHRPKRFAVTS